MLIRFTTIICAVIFSTSGFFANSLPASAHVLQIDQSIGAVLHVDPDDDPRAGQQASFFFEFKDVSNKFQLQNCDCKVFITKDSGEVFTEVLTNEPRFSYTFAVSGVYTLKVKGVPKTPDTFQDFQLSYDLRVSPNSTNAPSSSSSSSKSGHSLHFVIVGAGLVVIFFLYLKDKRKAKKLNDKAKVKQNIVSSVIALIVLGSLVFHNVHSVHASCDPVQAHATVHDCCFNNSGAVLAFNSYAEPKPTRGEKEVFISKNYHVLINHFINNKSPPLFI